MKTRGISCLAAIAILLTLTACAGPEITEQDSSMANAAALSRNYCVDARSRGEAARMAAIAQMDPSQQGVAIMAEAMRAQAEALGSKGDPCAPGMNAHEARARIAASQNEAATGLVGSLVRGTLIGMGIVEGADVIKTALKNSGDKTSIAGDGNSYAQERVTSDATITTKIKARFVDNKDVDASAISVETLNGTVMLSGFAKNMTEKSMAEKLAREVSGVKQVKNEIAIRP